MIHISKYLLILSSVLFISLKLNSQDTTIVYQDSIGNKISIDDLGEVAGNFTWENQSNLNIPEEAKILHQEARKLGSQGNFKKGTKKLLKAHKLAPQWAYPIYDLAYNYLLQEDFENALKYYDLTNKIEPKGFFTSKTASWSLKKEQEGVFNKGLYLAYLQHEWMQNDDEKIQLANMIIDKFPNYAPAWKLLGNLLSDNKARLEAIEKALSLDIDEETKGNVIINKALVMNLEGQSQEAIKLLGKLIFEEDTTSSNIQMAKAVISFIVKDK